MPYSYDVFDEQIKGIIQVSQPKTVLDIGAGAGKYGKMIREVSSEIKTTCVEIDKEYVEKFELVKIYDQVWEGDAKFLFLNPRLRFDLVIMGDVIEHMRKSEGIDLLNFLVYRTKCIIVVYPDKFIQDDWEGHAAEAHISTWGEDDFKGWDFNHQFKNGIHLFVVKGYQS